MSEKTNKGESSSVFRRRAYVNERPGITSVPSEELLRRLSESHRRREELLAKIRESQAKKAAFLIGTEQDPITVDVESEGTYDATTGMTPEAESISEHVLLPVARHEQEIIDMINQHKASIVISETGGGKSTQIPQFLMNAGYKHTFVAQGRRGMVDGLSDRIQYELDQKLGAEAAEGLVDSIHGGRSRRNENSRITVATAASLTFMLEDIEREYGDEEIAILADEIHEDDPHVELLVGAIGMAAAKHPKWRVVAMSATIDPEPLKIPLGRITNFDEPEPAEVPVITIEGRPHKVVIVESPNLTPAEAFVEHGQSHRVAMLASRGFRQLKQIKEDVIEGYEKRQTGSSAQIIFKEYSGKVSTFQREELARLATDFPEDAQLVILATPAARSGITIPGMTYLALDGVINREKRKEDQSKGIVTEYLSKAEIIQYAGRAGRDVDGGIVYLCKPMPNRRDENDRSVFAKVYPYVPIEEREEYATPAIFNSNLAELILNAATVGKAPRVINKFIINEQDERTLGNAIMRLRNEFGALDGDDKITPTGRLMSRFPVAPELARGLAEAVIQGRSQQQLGRMAFIAAGIDAGGLQMTAKSRDNAEWKSLLKSGSDDDFMAQLDFFMALEEVMKESASQRDKFVFAYNHDLDYSRVSSAEEPTVKILRRLGIKPELFELEPPSFKDMAELREDFTAGMYGLTFRQFQRRNDKNHYFRRIRGAHQHAELTLARQSVMNPDRGEIVAGMPQFYETIREGEKKILDIFGATLKVDVNVLARHALAGKLVEYVEVPNSERMDGGMVVESEQGMFGSLKVGGHRTVKAREFIPVASQNKLIDRVQNSPGREVLLLRDLASELADYRRLIPKELIDRYRRPDAPTDFTKTHIEKLLRHYAERTRDAQELDRLVGEHAYNNDLLIDMYYDSAARKEMLDRSPATFVIAGVEMDIHYDNGKPYVTDKLTQEQLAQISGPIYIDEGYEGQREILRQIRKEGGRGTRRVSFGSEA